MLAPRSYGVQLVGLGLGELLGGFGTAVANARSFPWSLWPGEDSTPLATSTANGRTTEIASPTFSE